jgi:magnesium chelatase family protein
MPKPATLGTLTSAVISGVRSTLVTVEVYRDNGLPGETIVGLPGAAVRESLRRIHSACKQSGVTLGPRSTTVNLAPADHPKGGTGLDLPIALGMLIAEGELEPQRLAGCVCLGELQLDGTVRSVPGTLPAALAARDAGIKSLLVPEPNVAEAAAVECLDVVGVRSLADAIDWARGGLALVRPTPPAAAPQTIAVDLCEVAGHALARRALEIAAAGAHHLLMIGLPGSGKTLLARALPGILPDLAPEEALEASAVHSAAGRLSGSGLLTAPPFRAPHHTVTAAGLVGGGLPPRPGEVSLAHHGVLFLDELPEFRRPVLECLRQPLEDATLSLVRGDFHVTLPARFQLVAAMNPCPCGKGADSDECRCSLGQVRGYWRRLSGPLLDRLDLVVTVEPTDLGALIHDGPAPESSAAVRRRVVAARQRQRQRFERLRAELEDAAATAEQDGASGGASHATTAASSRPSAAAAAAAPTAPTNAALPAAWLARACRLTPEQQRRAHEEAENLAISARGWHRVLRVARTIADLAGRDEIVYADLAEAFQYRQQGAELGAASR